MKTPVMLVLLAATTVAADRPRRHDWVGLAPPAPTTSITETVVVGRDAGAFKALRIDRVSGTVHLLRVHVGFSDGGEGKYQLNRYLDAQHASAYVDLGLPREIERIQITTARFPEGWYALSGRSGLPRPRNELIARASVAH